MSCFIKLMIWILSFEAISAGIGFAMRCCVDTWYQTLNRSALTPPDYIFGIVWPILYAVLAFAGYLIWKRDDGKLGDVKAIYMLQMLVNWSWTPVFFYFKEFGVSIGLIAGMIVTTLYMMMQLWNKQKDIALLFIPYLAWISFACYLNYFTWMNN